MKKMKQFLSSLLAVMVLLTAAFPAYAASFSDVADGVWYDEAVNYVTDNNLMDPLSTNRFAPDTDATRAALAVALYRAAGSPQVGEHSFNDIPAGSSYADAASWAQANGVIAGTGNGAFSGDDPITREQIVTILWRYAGSPTPGASQDFTDESSISAYAAQAVDWSRENGVVSGYDNGSFAPQAHTTRAQLAVILRGFLTCDQQAVPNEPAKEGRSLVVYFSMPETTNPNNMTTEEDNSTVVIDGQVLGNTQYMAQVIQRTVNGDIFRIEPVTPYPTDHSTLVDQALREQNESFRPAIKDQITNWDDYDTIFLGYPNWWGDMPMILYSFLDEYDFSGKTIIPFNTHGGSGFSSTVSTIARLEPNAEVSQNGLSISRNRIQDAEQEIINWVNSLNIQ